MLPNTIFQRFTERMMIHPKRGLISEEQCCLGLLGELGEVAELILEASTPDKMCKELGDVLWYATALAWHYDTNVQTLLNDTTPEYSRPGIVLAMCMVKHFGAAADHVKKVTRHDAEPDQALVLRSLRDGLGALKALAYRYGFSVDQVMDANVRKLKARWGDTFSGGLGDRSKPEAA